MEKNGGFDMSDIKELYEAINKQNLEAVKKLVEDPNIIKKINDHEVSDLTPLAVALQNVARPESKEKEKLAFLILNLLLKVRELDVNQTVTPMKGDTPLIYAIDMGFDEALLKPLLDRKDIDLNRKGQDGGTPLHHAKENGDEKLERFLIEKGADPSIEKDKRGKIRR